VKTTPSTSTATARKISLVAAVVLLGAAAPALAEPQDGGAVLAGPATGAVKSIAVAPDGVLGGALAAEFRNRGYTVVDSSALGASPSLAQLKAQGVDAVLSVRASAGADDQPQAASAQISSTSDGQVLAKVTWQNGWGGWRGSKASPAGRIMHKNVSQAAREITDGLVKTLL